MLDPALSSRLEGVNVRGTSLILITASSTWASRLRYASPDILEALRKVPELAHVQRCRIVVSPTAVHSPQSPAPSVSPAPPDAWAPSVLRGDRASPSPEPARRAIPMSIATLDLLESTAKALESGAAVRPMQPDADGATRMAGLTGPGQTGPDKTNLDTINPNTNPDTNPDTRPANPGLAAVLRRIVTRHRQL
ncbi:MAG: DciA family protein [Gammaproteobacteria bacterium]